MNINSLNKKAQGLPLNTIVIAILVIIVLLVIVVAFTSNFTKSNDQLGEVSGCTLSNAALSINYRDVQTKSDVDSANFNGNAACSEIGSDWRYISVIPKQEKTDSDGNVIAYNICCGLPKN
jgi:competence protein ComGC